MRLRRLLFAGIAVAVLLAVGLAAAGYALYSNARVDTVGELDFSQRLRIPPLLEPTVDADGRKRFDLTLREGRAELLPGRPTPTWGINGPYLGPTLRATRGDRVQMNVTNDLPEPTTLHWHGMHLPAAADGGPHQPIEPGASWRPGWTVDQPATTLWYHPHPHGQTADHVYRGLAGMFIVDDPRAAAGLPDDYGVDDIPVIIQDPRLSDDGELELSKGIISPTGRLGDQTLVNGTFDPYLPVSRRRVRFRLLNASSARVYDVGFADERELLLVGTDGGPLVTPRRVRRVRLSPGDRAEVVAEFRPGENVVLRSFEPELGADFFNERFTGGDDSFDLLQVRAEPRLERSPGVPRRLAAGDEALDPAQAVRTRRFELTSSSRINGRSMDMHRIDAVMRPGTTEVWEVENSDGVPHSFHPHDVRFRVVAYSGGPVPADLSGLQDTVFVPPGETLRLVTRFEDYADSETPYMFHCHILDHEDRGMMGQFVVAGSRHRGTH